MATTALSKDKGIQGKCYSCSSNSWIALPQLLIMPLSNSFKNKNKFWKNHHRLISSYFVWPYSCIVLGEKGVPFNVVKEKQFYCYLQTPFKFKDLVFVLEFLVKIMQNQTPEVCDKTVWTASRLAPRKLAAFQITVKVITSRAQTLTGSASEDLPGRRI